MSGKFVESETIDHMRDSLRQCIDACDNLARYSLRGLQYDRLRKHLEKTEGACREMAVFRNDARWLPFGMFMANAHKLAGLWLRGYMKDGIYHVWTTGHQNQMFVQLGKELKVILEGLDKMATAATGTTSPILPSPPAEERRIGRPGFDLRPKAQRTLIVPASYRRVG